MIHRLILISEVLGVVLSFCVLGINYSVAQTTNSSTPITNFVDSDPANKDHYVNVKYESPQTVILITPAETDLWTVLGHAIDFAKQKGFGIDSTSVVLFEPESGFSSGREFHYVFMSK